MSIDLESRTFTQAPVTRPFPSTGSIYYRYGAFNGRSLTFKEQQFEQFVNDMQARHDELSVLREWRRLKDIEEEAISLYHELGKNLDEYKRQMRTRDQMEMEYQCQRKRQKSENLNPQTVLWKSQKRLHEYLGAKEAGERAKDQERIRSNAVADFKARVQASSDSVADANITTNAAGSQQASQQSELIRSKPEKGGNTSQSVSPTGAGSSRQQEQKTKLSEEELCRQFRDKVQLLQATTSTTPTVTATVRPIPPEAADSAQRTQAKEPDAALPAASEDPFEAELAALPAASEDRFKAVLAGYQPRMGIVHGTHYPKGAVLVKSAFGLTKLHLGCRSVANQSRARDIVQVREPSDRSSSSPSSPQTSSEGSTPPTTAPPSPPTTPIVSLLNAHGTRAVNLTNNDQNEEIDNSKRLLELEWANHGNVRSTTRWDRLRPALKTDPFLNSFLQEHIDYQRKKTITVL